MRQSLKKSEFLLNKDVFAAVALVVTKFVLSLFWGEPVRLYRQAADNCVKFPCLDKAEIMSCWKDHEIRKKSFLNYTQFVSGVPRSQWFGPVSPGRPGRDGYPEHWSCCFWKSFWLVPHPGWYSLMIWPLHHGNVPLDRVWFITSLSQRV